MDRVSASLYFLTLALSDKSTGMITAARRSEAHFIKQDYSGMDAV